MVNNKKQIRLLGQVIKDMMNVTGMTKEEATKVVTEAMNKK